MPYLKPIEIRLPVKPNDGRCHRATIVYPGIGNTAFSRRFFNYSDMLEWAKREYHDVPRIQE